MLAERDDRGLQIPGRYWLEERQVLSSNSRNPGVHEYSAFNFQDLFNRVARKSRVRFYPYAQLLQELDMGVGKSLLLNRLYIGDDTCTHVYFVATKL